LSIPKRDVDELYAKFDLHPDLIEIYVEGEFDYSIINFYLEEIGAKSATVVCIDDIDINSRITDAFNLKGGSNKNRVLALASLLDNRYNNRPTNVCCIVDVDLDVMFSNIRDSHHLRYTDYSCMEMYFLSKSIIDRFLKLVCNLDDHECSEFLSLADLILPAQFALRIVNESEKIFKSVLEFEAGLKKKKDFKSFDPMNYCSAYINFYGLGKNRVQIEAAFKTALSNLHTDIRNSSNGHDFIHLLYEFSHQRSGLQLHNKEKSEAKYGGRIVALAASSQHLMKEKLFFDIHNAVNGNIQLCP
jgi:hypothetical protein